MWFIPMVLINFFVSKISGLLDKSCSGRIKSFESIKLLFYLGSQRSYMTSDVFGVFLTNLLFSDEFELKFPQLSRAELKRSRPDEPSISNILNRRTKVDPPELYRKNQEGDKSNHTGKSKAETEMAELRQEINKRYRHQEGMKIPKTEAEKHHSKK